MEVAEFIAQKYYHDDTLQEVQRIREMLAHPGVYFEGIPDNGVVLVYITLSDTGLKMLKDATTVDHFKNGFTEKLLAHPGHHIYVFRLVAENKPALHELRHLRTKIMNKHQATSFSWHDDNRVVLHTYER